MFPEKFLKRMQDMLGQEYEDFVRSLEAERCQALRVNPLKGGRTGETEGTVETERIGETEVAGKLESYFKLTQVSWEKNGFYYTKEDQPGKHPLHEAGVYYIQEPSAMAVVPLLEVKPGEHVLDLCAAPGGKSTQIAGYLRGEGLLVSNEIHPARAKILSENMERLGVRNACVTNENSTSLSQKFPEYFNRILVDAPCSGEGMFRKNDIACEEWSEENVILCAKRQDEILDEAAKMLMPGGRLVYSTCTFAPAENEGTISRFLQRHPEFKLIPIDKTAMGLPEGKCDGRPEWADGKKELADGKTEWADREDLRYTLRLWPHIVKGEGHFAAVLQKEGQVSPGYRAVATGGTEKGIAPKDPAIAAWREFWRETGRGGKTDRSSDTAFDEGVFLRFGDHLYLAPKDMPSLKGLKVLRPGLQLGTLKKDRFEPSHALALALKPEEVRHECRFLLSDDGQSENVSAYLKGQTFPMDGEKGWYLITADGFGIGWGKLAGGIMKNHYPKGLRKP